LVWNSAASIVRAKPAIGLFVAMTRSSQVTV
jgi:hypothetical protein